MWRFIEFTTVTIGIYASYLTYGYVQEALYQPHEDGSRFEYTGMLLFVQCVSNAMIGLVAHFIWEALAHRTPVKDTKRRQTMFHFKPQLEFALVAFTYLAAMACSNEAIKFVSYPTQALAKSCKMIPVMLAQVFYLGRKYPLKKYLCVAAMVVGIAVFQLARHKPKQAVAEINEDVDPIDTLFQTIWGYVLLFLSLSCDGFTGPKQENLRGRFQFTPLQLMVVQNAWAALFAGIWAAASNEIGPSWAFVITHPKILKEILLFALTSGIGQIFVFYTVVRFDSLVLTTITTTRKFFTILVSVVLHGHILSMIQWCGVWLVFGAIIADKLSLKSFFGKHTPTKQIHSSHPIKTPTKEINHMTMENEVKQSSVRQRKRIVT